MDNRYKILVVDDDPEVREFLANFLRMQGFEVDTESSGERAFHLASKEYFHIIISDLVMETERAGIELLKKLRKEGIDSRFILVTGYGNPEIITTAFREGANDYFSKPIRNIKEILLSINRQIMEIEKDISSKLFGGKERIILSFNGAGALVEEILSEIIDFKEIKQVNVYRRKKGPLEVLKANIDTFDKIKIFYSLEEIAASPCDISFITLQTKRPKTRKEALPNDLEPALKIAFAYHPKKVMQIVITNPTDDIAFFIYKALEMKYPEDAGMLKKKIFGYNHLDYYRLKEELQFFLKTDRDLLFDIVGQHKKNAVLPILQKIYLESIPFSQLDIEMYERIMENYDSFTETVSEKPYKVRSTLPDATTNKETARSFKDFLIKIFRGKNVYLSTYNCENFVTRPVKIFKKENIGFIGEIQPYELTEEQMKKFAEINERAKRDIQEFHPVFEKILKKIEAQGI